MEKYVDLIPEYDVYDRGLDEQSRKWKIDFVPKTRTNDKQMSSSGLITFELWIWKKENNTLDVVWPQYVPTDEEFKKKIADVAIALVQARIDKEQPK